jgi:TRAP-type C4-dicarboxylate transport system permease small subunit
MNIITTILIVAMNACTVWLVWKAAVAAQDPEHPFGQLEFAFSAMALLCCSILISYFAIVYIILEPEAKPSITQSSHVTYSRDYVACNKHRPRFKTIKGRP